MDEYTANREFMKSGICDIGIIATADIARGISQPPFEKPYSAGVKKIALPTIDRDSAPKVKYEHIL
jgi:hypothetical protein